MNYKNQHTTTEQPTVADDILNVMDVENREAEMRGERSKAFNDFRAGTITRDEYNAIVQTGLFGEGTELDLRRQKEVSLDRINDTTRGRSFGRKVLDLFGRK